MEFEKPTRSFCGKPPWTYARFWKITQDVHTQGLLKKTTPGPHSKRPRERERSRARSDDAGDESWGGPPGVPGGDSGGGPPGESGSTIGAAWTIVSDFRLMPSNSRQHGHRITNACWLHVSGCSMKTKSSGIKYQSELCKLHISSTNRRMQSRCTNHYVQDCFNFREHDADTRWLHSLFSVLDMN